MNRSGAPIYEHEIQRIWAEQDFDSSGLKTVDGKKASDLNLENVSVPTESLIGILDEGFNILDE